MNLQDFISHYVPIVFNGDEFTQKHLNQAVQIAVPGAFVTNSIACRNTQYAVIDGAIVTMDGVYMCPAKILGVPLEDNPIPSSVKIVAALMKRLGVVDNIKQSISAFNHIRQLSPTPLS